jgi:IS5 family transposase
MLLDGYEKDKFFESIFCLAVEMDPELAQIDRLLDDEELYQLIRADVAQRHPHTATTGRPSTPVEVILRMLVIRRLYGWSYEESEQRVRDSLVLRMFCRVYFQPVPDDTTLIRWAAQVQPETLEAFNRRITRLALELKVTKGRKLRTDGTVVETNIAAPVDSRLLADSVRVLGRTLSRAKTVLAEQTELAQTVFRNRTRSARRTARRAAQLIGRHKERGQAVYRQLVRIVRRTVSQAQTVLVELKAAAGKPAESLAETLEAFIPRAEQVIDQAVRRVFQGEQVPAEEKLVSIFEPHSDIIVRGKAGKPVEYGHKIWLDEVEGGIVTRWDVLDGNPNDQLQWTDSLDGHEDLFGKPPTQASADRGVYSPKNEQAAQTREIARVVLPKPGYKSAERKQHEQQAWFRKGRHWHHGVEGRISVLKRRFDLARCRDHGQAGFDRWVGWAVIANNLVSIGRHQAAKVG